MPLEHSLLNDKDPSVKSDTFRCRLHAFLESKNTPGAVFEGFTIFLIVINVCSFIASSGTEVA